MNVTRKDEANCVMLWEKYDRQQIYQEDEEFIPFLYINLTKQLVFKNHSYYHQATAGFSLEKKTSDSEREPFSLRSAKSSSPSGSQAGSD
uniref:Uncharacterized protein n=1 Tax=Populus trichocarpa TaxID=3694 RepID=A0A2K1WX79_POPTR